MKNAKFVYDFAEAMPVKVVRDAEIYHIYLI